MTAATATKTMGAGTPAESPLAKPAPALVVFGTDKSGKPHAGWFAGAMRWHSYTRTLPQQRQPNRRQGKPAIRRTNRRPMSCSAQR
ncbi:hypothetical protein JOE48_000124 [Methylobacterium sp. PvR107]|nr:hypothetical protein [Methylobacterium sp. PvR107]